MVEGLTLPGTLRIESGMGISCVGIEFPVRKLTLVTIFELHFVIFHYQRNQRLHRPFGSRVAERNGLHFY